MLKYDMLKKVAAASMVPLLLCAAGANAASFTGIGMLEGQSQSRANAVSGDGATVVGAAGTGNGAAAFYWTETSGLVALDATNGGIQFAHGVNSDGSVIVGSDSGFDSFRWTTEGGMQDIGTVGGLSGRVIAKGVSADGSTIVGQNLLTGGGRLDAFRWTQTPGATSLGFFPDVGSNDRVANAAATSADGSVVVGESGSVDGNRAFRWTASGGMISLGTLPRADGNSTSAARAVSNNGVFVVGDSFSEQGLEAFMWTEVDGMIGLGELPGGFYSSQATGVSADGSIVVGNSADGTSNFNTAFIWDPANGMRNLKTLLENEGLDLAGWELRVTTGVSDDGTVISGWGVNPDGQTEGWVAQIDFVDTDGDGVPDSTDACPLDPMNDADGDGVCGDIDNCPVAGDQTDSDGDGLGDVCDACPADASNDADGDGMCEAIDNCPLIANADQLDNDNDQQGDACDTDDDNDSYSDEADNCPLQVNDQTDSDGDGAGDACDADADADGVVDAEDACLLSSTGETVNASGCAVADLCPCTHSDSNKKWKNHGAYVKCVAHTSKDFVDAALLTQAEKDAMQSAAGASSCGKKK